MIPGPDAFYVIREEGRYGPYTREMLRRLEQLGYVTWADQLMDSEGDAWRFSEVVAARLDGGDEYGDVPPAVSRILGFRDDEPPRRERRVESPRAEPPARARGREEDFHRTPQAGGTGELFDQGGAFTAYADAPPYEEEGSAEDDVIYRGKPSPWNYPLLMLLVLAALTAGLLQWNDSRIWFAGGCFAASAFLFIIEARRAASVYLISDSRVEAITGLVSRSSREMRISDIRSIDVRKHGWKGFLNLGDVRFSSTGTDQEDVVFVGVGGPHRLKRLVRSLQGA